MNKVTVVSIVLCTCEEDYYCEIKEQQTNIFYHPLPVVIKLEKRHDPFMRKLNSQHITLFQYKMPA